MAEVTVPVAYCNTCKKDIPVFIGNVDMNMPDAPEMLKGLDLEVIICPICETILNLNGPVTVTYYDLDDIKTITPYEARIKDD